jgi:hypothetical protein
MKHLDEHTVLTRYLGKVQQHCTLLIQQQQEEIACLKAKISNLESALRAQQICSNAQVLTDYLTHR